AKLKTAYEEKSEINAKLKQAYEEKSEINAKLKLTVEEKAKLSESLEQERKEKKKLEEEFAARSAEALLAAKREREALAAQIRGTYSYRLGAIILYIPQRIVKIINRIKVRRSR
ncbi:MAG: hypothetical protein LUE96_02695, partial [Lachnospiraceae bacterium]|nr:hypothetical protein [Lachnospiraceae bacterium]